MNPGAAGQGRRSCHRLNVCHCCSPTKKKKKQKKTYLPISLTTSSNSSKTITILNSQNNIILLLFQTQNPPHLAGIFNTLFASSSSTPYLHLHLQHPFCIFIFNTHLASWTPHFASSSWTPIWHHLETTHFVSSTCMILCINHPNLQQLQQQHYHAMVQSSTLVTPMVDEICSSFQRFLFLVEYESFFLSELLPSTNRQTRDSCRKDEEK